MISLDLKKVKIVVSEVDGIITEGVLPYDELCNTLFKEYYFKDFEAINEIKKYFKFVFISKDNAISYNLCRKKNIPYFWSRAAKEKTLTEEILPKYGVDLSNVIYIGCSFSDEKAMALSQITVCPYDSPNVIKRISTVTLNTPGGCGVLSDFYESVILYNLSTI